MTTTGVQGDQSDAVRNAHLLQCMDYIIMLAGIGCLQTLRASHQHTECGACL
jgi:hypothetical protein